MVYFKPNEEDTSHKRTVLKQIRLTNDIISGFNTAPSTINALANQYDYTQGAADGKKIALAILVLLSNARPLLPLQFFQNLKNDNKYKQAFQKTEFREPDGLGHKTTVGYAYLSKDQQIQFEAILKILTFYSALLDAIYSLPDFSDVILMNQKKDTRRTEINEDSEEELFEL